MRRTSLMVMTCATVAAAAQAGTTVDVTITGTVEFNQITPAPLGLANPGDDVEITFQLDSMNFVDSAMFPTRGYAIDLASFSFTAGAASLSLQNPYPAGETPYFILRDNDPAVWQQFERILPWRSSVSRTTSWR